MTLSIQQARSPAAASSTGFYLGPWWGSLQTHAWWLTEEGWQALTTTALQPVEFFSGSSISMLVSPTSPENSLLSANLPGYQEQKWHGLLPNSRRTKSCSGTGLWVAILILENWVWHMGWSWIGSLAINSPSTVTGSNFHVWTVWEHRFTTFRTGPSAPTEMYSSNTHCSDRRKSLINTENFWNPTLGKFWMSGCSHLAYSINDKEKRTCAVKWRTIAIKGYKNSSLQYYKDAVQERNYSVSWKYVLDSQ